LSTQIFLSTVNAMAELMGVVRSGIPVAQLPGEISRCVAKIKDYWDRVSEVSSEIRDRFALFYAVPDEG
jgi:hypothetical protein